MQTGGSTSFLGAFGPAASIVHSVHYSTRCCLVLMGCDGKCYTCYYRPQRSCGKVKFLQTSVILFTAGGGGALACQGGLACQGACVSGGVAVRGCAWQGVVHGGHGRGLYVWQGVCVARGRAYQERRPLQRTVRTVRILLECILVWFNNSSLLSG